MWKQSLYFFWLLATSCWFSVTMVWRFIADIRYNWDWNKPGYIFRFSRGWHRGVCGWVTLCRAVIKLCHAFTVYLKLSHKVADLCIDDRSVVQQSWLDITHICRMSTDWNKHTSHKTDTFNNCLCFISSAVVLNKCFKKQGERLIRV